MLNKYYHCKWCGAIHIAKKTYGIFQRLTKCNVCGFDLVESDSFYENPRDFNRRLKSTAAGSVMA